MEVLDYSLEERDQLTLCDTVALDVLLCRGEISMPGEELYIAERAVRLCKLS